jgi:hypothetical protein
MVLVHADSSKAPVLPAGVTLQCVSRLTFMSDKAGSSPAPVNGSSIFVTSSVITLGSKDAAQQCPQDPGGAYNGCGVFGNVAVPVPSAFDCQTWLYWQIVNCTAVTVRRRRQGGMMHLLICVGACVWCPHAYQVMQSVFYLLVWVYLMLLPR